MQGRFEKRGAIGLIWINHPPVNAISAGVRKAIIHGCSELAKDPELKAGLLICESKTFMAGADITEFGKAPEGPSWQEVLDALENSPKPITAAIHGTAFGGGLEMALACHYRVAVPSAQIGLPEVKLGILPGAGGTQRLPRLLGVEWALNAIVSGDPIPALLAAKGGAIDKIIEGDLLEGALIYVQDLIDHQDPCRKVRDIVIDPATVPPHFFEEARKRIAKEKRNLFAPQRIVDAVEAAVTLPFEAGLAKERELIEACFANSQSKALQHVFFAERQVAKIPGLAPDIKARPVQKVAVIGAGTMGGGIAMNFANAGIPTLVLEASKEALDRGMGIVRKNYESTAAKGKLTTDQVEQRMALLQPTLSYDDLADADLIIEAVFETMDIKKKVFSALDRVAKPGAILASNTSYLSIDEIAQSTSRPGDVVGMHFFSPANVMRLLEIVRGKNTASDVLVTTLEVARKIKKVGVVSGNCFGFIGNRMLEGYAREANLLLLEGASPEQIDKALVEFGMPMGIFQMADLAGLDVGYKSRKDRDPATYEVRSGRVSDKLVEMGRLGQKTSAGFYDYEPGNRTPIPSKLVAETIAETAQEYQIQPRDITTQEIIERCFLAMINIGCEVLREGMAYRSGDIDIVYLYGYGFPAYRGGPMHWVEKEIGLPAALEKIRTFAKSHGSRWWTPSPLLERLVAEGKGFTSLA